MEDPCKSHAHWSMFEQKQEIERHTERLLAVMSNSKAALLGMIEHGEVSEVTKLSDLREGHLGGVRRLEMMGPIKQARPMAAKRSPSVVELSPSDCMLFKLLKRTCKISDAPHTIAPLAFIKANAAASLHAPLSLLLHASPAKRQGASCKQAAGEGCHNPTPCWTRQTQARPNQPWACCSVFIPPPASRGHLRHLHQPKLEFC